MVSKKGLNMDVFTQSAVFAGYLICFYSKSYYNQIRYQVMCSYMRHVVCVYHVSSIKLDSCGVVYVCVWSVSCINVVYVGEIRVLRGWSVVRVTNFS